MRGKFWTILRDDEERFHTQYVGLAVVVGKEMRPLLSVWREVYEELHPTEVERDDVICLGFILSIFG